MALYDYITENELAEMLQELRAKPTKQVKPKHPAVIDIVEPFYDEIKEGLLNLYQNDTKLSEIARIVYRLGTQSGKIPYARICSKVDYKNGKSKDTPYSDCMHLVDQAHDESVIEEIEKERGTVKEIRDRTTQLQSMRMEEKLPPRDVLVPLKVTHKVIENLFIKSGYIDPKPKGKANAGM